MTVTTTTRPVLSRAAERAGGLRPQAKITTHERAMIDAMRRHLVRGGAGTASWLGSRTGQTPQGAAGVLASCVRKGLVTRESGRPVTFSLTRRGWDLAAPRTRPAAAPPKAQPAVRIDQAKIAAWIDANPPASGVKPAAYPRPLDWWRGYVPSWVTVGEEPGGIITMTHKRTDGTPAMRRRRAETLRFWVMGIRPLAAALITEEQACSQKT